MTDKIYITATDENKHLIIPYLESLGGKLPNMFTSNKGFERMIFEGCKIYIDKDGCFEGCSYAPEGYTEYKLNEPQNKPDELTALRKENDELTALRKENEVLKSALKDLHYHCTTFNGVDREAFDKAIETTQNLLKP